jgi:hypothetical protein
MSSSFSLVAQIPDRLRATRFQKSNVPLHGTVAWSTPLKGETGALSPWQKRNFLPLPHGHG